MTREQFISHVEGCQKAFRRFLTALCCGDSSLADDIAQDALVKAYLASEGFEKTESFKAWVYRIGYNTFLNHKRSERIFAGYDEAAKIASTDMADAYFRYQNLYAALDRLSPKERTEILLFYIEGYSVKEIAKIVEATPDAVKQHLSRARRHLRENLSKNGR